MSTIYKTSTISKFYVGMNNNLGTYVFVPKQKRCKSRKFLPNIMTTIRCGWYLKDKFDSATGLPYSNMPYINESQKIYIDNTSDENAISFENSNFKYYMMPCIDFFGNRQYYHQKIVTDDQNIIKEIELYKKGLIRINMEEDFADVHMSIESESDCYEIENKIMQAIKKYEFFTIDNDKLTFINIKNGDSIDTFKI